MTTRYSRREGAPLQGWAGGNEGCWATARPAAPPPAPPRDALAKSTGFPPIIPAILPVARTLSPSWSPRSPSSTRCLFAASPRPYRPTLCVYFGLILRHLSSYASFVPFPFFLPSRYHVLLSHSLFLASSVFAARASRFFIHVSFAPRR